MVGRPPAGPMHETSTISGPGPPWFQTLGAAGRRVLSLGERWLTILHRWMGVLACVYFAIWFISGLVLMYVGFPDLTDSENLRAAQPIAWSQVKVGPGQALLGLGLDHYPKNLKLENSGGEPVYVATDWDGSHLAASATTGRPILAVDRDRALQIARAFAPATPASWKRLVRVDQWTVKGKWEPLRPFHLIALNDGQGGELYVSARTGEVVLRSTFRERAWNYLGAVPHWLYFTAIRYDTGAWRWWVMCAAGLGIAVAVSGVWQGLLRLRLRRRYADGSVSPFRGWMKWHHVLGLFGGLFLLIWIVTGWLSVNPNGWLEADGPSREGLQAYAGHASPDFPAAPGVLARGAGAAARQVQFLWMAGRPVAVSIGADLKPRAIAPETGTSAPLSGVAVVRAAAALMPQARITFSQRLDQEDEYWHSAFEKKSLPAIRVGFNDAAHTWFYLDPDTGAVLDRQDDTARAYRWIFQGLHDLDFLFLLKHRPLWDLVIWPLALAGLAISVTVVVIGYRRIARDLERRRLPAPPGAASPAFEDEAWRPDPGDPVLVAYSSQTGTAERLARAAADLFDGAGHAVRLERLERLDDEDLRGFGFAVFVIATAGDGDPPDLAMAFERKAMRREADLAGLRYGLLALGDRKYTHFNGFGRAVDAWLRGAGARPVAPVLEVDDLGADTLAAWSARLTGWTGRTPAVVELRGPFEPWRLVARTFLNPEGLGAPAFHIELEPPPGTSWTAGDVVQLAPEHGAGAYREYSVASLGDDGRAHLLVRQMRGPDGALGLASGWLTQDAAIGASIPGRIRPNPSFHPAGDHQPVVLIGAGTGMAGLRVHLRHRARAGAGQSWLVFGERSERQEFFYRDELQGYVDAGLLTVDVAFSRDGPQRHYVQHVLLGAADRVRDWVARGAAILVCGSRDGMGDAVHAALEDILGPDVLDGLIAAGRYRRDVY